MPIQYHSDRAGIERLVAAGTRNAGEAAIHVALAELHEQAAARGVNTSLAPFERPRAYATLDRLYGAAPGQTLSCNDSGGRQR